MGGGRVLEVGGRSEWDRYQGQSSKERKLLVADFTAKWCGPCRIMTPVFEELSTKYPSALFLKVDVDDNGDVASEYGVRGIPAFLFFKGGKKVDEIVGADQNKLRALVEKHYEVSSFQGQGQKLGTKEEGGETAPSHAAPAPPPTGGDPSAVDESKPVTSIQIRLPDGSRLVGRFNTDAPLSEIRAFVAASKPSLPATFQILDSFPPRPILSFDKTIAEAGLLNASLQIRG